MLLSKVEVDGRIVDVRLGAGTILEIGQLRREDGEEVVPGRRGALVAGLHDHHLHLHALAADRRSVDCSRGLDALRGSAPGPDGWVRGVHARESVDRHALDRLVPDVPVRVQHRSGGLWMLNSTGLDAVRLDQSPDVERGAEGRPTGRLWRYDERLRASLPRASVDLAPLAEELASYGLTSVTDATPDLDASAVTSLRSFTLPVTMLGDPDGEAPWKILLRDHDLPTFEDLEIVVRRTRPRPVAVHCVTRESLLLTLAVLDQVGRVAGDRVEHAAVVPAPDALRGLVVVTQPAFVTTRGEDYRREVDPDDLPHLYRYRSLTDAGVEVLPSSDAPYGPVDPWEVIRAARERDLGPAEGVSAATTLCGYQARRRVATGPHAGLVLLHSSLAEALDAPDSAHVRTTWSGHQRRPVGPHR